jgi:hypothetical protein
MAEDKLIKSGQFTITRLLFLAACGALIFGVVALGGQFLRFGYLLLTAVICVLLYLISIDYGVTMDKVDTSGHAQPAGVDATLSTGAVAEDNRPRRKSAKAVRRRR